MSGRKEDLPLVRRYYKLKSDLAKARHSVNPDKERITALEMEMTKLENSVKPFMRLNTK